MVQLKGYKLNSVYFENKVAGNTKLALQNQVKYNVNYIEDESRCIGTLNFRVFDTDMQPFEIKIEAVPSLPIRQMKKNPIFISARLTNFFRLCVSAWQH